MRNSLGRTIYHSFVCKFYKMKSFRGGWMLTHLYIQDYKQGKVPVWKIIKAHFRGWSYSDWAILGLTDANFMDYLSTRDYCSLHPLNGEYSYWIDDKLTLKYILYGTAAGKYMPDYYFLLEKNGNVVPLMDVPDEYRNQGFIGVTSLLEEKSKLAFKAVKGSLGIGFYKAEFDGTTYFLNGESLSKSDFMVRIKELKGYLITEYLSPHPDIAKFCNKSVGCLRYLVGRRLNGDLQEIYSFMRFGTEKSKYVENYNSGGVLAILTDGNYSFGNVLDFNLQRNVVVNRHPDTGIEIKGKIPHWDEVKRAVYTIAEVMPQLSYMGIDFCITDDDRVKVIEINSLTSLDSIQLDHSIFVCPGGVFFNERLSKT